VSGNGQVILSMESTKMYAMKKLVLFILCISFIACSKASDNKAKDPTYQNLGDPAMLVFGAKMENALPMSLFANNKCSYFYSDRSRYDNKMITETTTQYNTSQAPKERTLTRSLYTEKDRYCLKGYSSQIFDTQKNSYFLFTSGTQNGHNLIFRQNGNVLQLVGMEYQGSEYELNQEIIHISVNPSGSAFTILFYDNLFSEKKNKKILYN
jgi:hypothetical protein